MLLSPLWPPAEPAPRSRKRPGGRATSSTSTSRCCAGSKAGSARSGATAAPLRFMYVCGLSSLTARPCTVPEAPGPLAPAERSQPPPLGEVVR
jgi:hypothetical protein